MQKSLSLTRLRGLLHMTAAYDSYVLSVSNTADHQVALASWEGWQGCATTSTVLFKHISALALKIRYYGLGDGVKQPGYVVLEGWCACCPTKQVMLLLSSHVAQYIAHLSHTGHQLLSRQWRCNVISIRSSASI